MGTLTQSDNWWQKLLEVGTLNKFKSPFLGIHKIKKRQKGACNLIKEKGGNIIEVTLLDHI